MPVSAVVVNRRWDEHVDPELCPQRHPDVAEVRVDDVIVVTHPHAEKALALEPLSAVLWSSFDGATPLAALADDLVESVGLTGEEASEQLDGMCRWLGWRGFLVEPHVPEALRHDWFPALEDDACPAKKMGLADAELLDLAVGDRTLRIGATDEEVVAALAAAFADQLVPADPAAEREIVCANIGAPVGRQRPRHRVVDHWGNLLYSGRRRDVAAASLARIIDDRLASTGAEGAPWLETPVLEHDGRMVLVHRGLVDALQLALPRLERNDIRFYESPYVRLDAERAEVVVTEPSADLSSLAPGEREPELTTTPAGRYPLVGIVAGGSDLPRYELVRAISQLAVRWDQVHLDAVDVLTQRVPTRRLDPDHSAPGLARSLGRAFGPA